MTTEPAPLDVDEAPPYDAAPVSPLVGRDDELALLLRLLAAEAPAIVNVTGAHGIGKSALVRAALVAVEDDFDEVVDLDLTGESPTSALAGLRRHLARLPVPLSRASFVHGGIRTLVHLERADCLAHAERALVDVVRGNGTVHLVVESVPPLRAPEITAVQLGPLGRSAAHDLFRHTASLVGVTLDPGDGAVSEDIQRVCSAVDANPLAIEVAAARLPALPLASLAAALEAPGRALAVLSVPEAGGGDVPTIRSHLVDSHRGTSSSAQRLLDLLSVFAGSFTLDAVEAVSDERLSHPYDALTELLDLRLVELDPVSGHGRYRLSRLVRAFAAERLAASGLETEARARHADYYADVARRAALAHDDADEETARTVLGEDYAEALAALRWVREQDPARALRLAADLGWEAYRRGGGAALAEALESLLQANPPGTEAARRDALLWLAQLESWSPLASDRVELIGSRLAEAVDLAHRVGEPLGVLHALRAQFLSLAAHGELADALAASSQGMELAAAIGHARWLGRFEVSRSAVHALVHQYDLAVPLAASGLARAVRSNDRLGIALGSLALHAMPAEQVADRAGLPSLEAVLEIFRSHGDLRNEIHTLATLAQEAVDRGDPLGAARWVLARQTRLGRTDLLHGLTVSVMLAVHISRMRGEYAVSARLHGTVASHLEPLLMIMAPRHVELYRSGLESVRASLPEGRFDAEVAEGRVLDREQTLVELLSYLRDVVAAPAPDAVPEPEEVPPERAADSRPRTGELTPREEQVLDLLGRGLRNKEIAAELGTTPKSVMHHTVSIYRRLGVRSRTEAVTVAVREGLITVD